METKSLIKLLEGQLVRSEQSVEIYRIRLKNVIDGLRSGFYIQREEGLILDLQSLGFLDIARDIRKGLYV